MILLSLIAVAAAVKVANEVHADNELLPLKEIAAHVNSIKTTWQASHQQDKLYSLTVKEAKKMMGALLTRPANAAVPVVKNVTALKSLPTNFDSRVQWPHCPTIKRVRDQSACGSCWAFSAVEAMSDRYCVAGLNANLSISAEQMTACCDSCGNGCDGGYPPEAWNYWVNTGVVSNQCQPYSLPSCDHHVPGPHPCPTMDYPTPQCNFGTCSPNASYPWNLHFGASSYTITSGVDTDIMTEIMTNGPVQTAFSVYADFLTYKSGVYQHKTGQFLGGHAVKIIGWGVDSASNKKYWLVANSWNPTWGDHGFFKILRGVDECGFEDEISAGLPQN